MIMIEGEKSNLYQWDLNMRLLLINIPVGVEVHFDDVHNTVQNCPKVVSYEEDGNVYADIPNIFLQKPGMITVYIYVQEENKRYTKYNIEILVLPRKKPADYVYTETEIKRWDDVVAAAEATSKTVVDDGIANGLAEIKAYNDTNIVPAVQASFNASAASAESAKQSEESSVKSAESATVAQEAAMSAKASASEALSHAQAMAGTFDFTGYLRYMIVEEVPTEQENGVIYIVQTT